MEVAEIYSTISSHMLKGIMLHEQFANYYDFLGLKGYKRCHEYHMLTEMLGYRSLSRYFINHHNKLISDSHIENPEVIPSSWYKYTRQDVDTNTKKNAVKVGLEKWISWERETKQLYENMYRELMNLGEIASAMKIEEYIYDVDCELKKAEQYKLDKEAVNYDLVYIVEEQKRKHRKYQRKVENLHILL